MSAIAWLLPAVVLLAASALKAADRTGATVALAAYGIPGRLAAPAWAGLIVLEAALAAGIAAGVPAAPYAAGLVLAGFLLFQVVALAQGNEGAPCGCFGAGGRLSRAAAGRTALLAVACAVLPQLGPGPGIPLVAAAAVAAATVVLASGRRAAPRGALEVDGEGPPLGATSPLEGWFDGDGVRLALFTSPGCSLCRRVAPAADALAGDGVAVRRSTRSRIRRRGPRGGCPARRSRSRSGRAASCSPRARSTTRASSRRSSPPRGRGGPGRGYVAAGVPLPRAAPRRRGGRPGMVGAVIRPGDATPTTSAATSYDRRLPAPDRAAADRPQGAAAARAGRQARGRPRPADRRRRAAGRRGRGAAHRPRGPPAAAGAAHAGLQGRRRRATGCASRRTARGTAAATAACASSSTAARRTRADQRRRSLKGYCYNDRKVFCVMYYQSSVPC